MPVVIDEMQVETQPAAEKREGGGGGGAGGGGGGEQPPKPEEVEKALRAQLERAERVWAH